jgi:uncharacterized paraquat-inducible protein A
METIICQECESEFKVVEEYSEFEIAYCPYCGDPLTEPDDE